MYNFPQKEQKILKFWQENKIFEKLREKNKGKERWSFLDGPITANNPMGAHHAWGRSYKDIFQRYKAMQGYEQRYQNGFDCQGLWVEVEVEKELGFKNKKDIEKYGIDKFVEKCKERVKKYSAIQTQQSIRLGQCMDWENSYYTMSDENNYAIWHFLKKCWQDGYLYKGRDSVPWCPRCGTAISQHEILTEEYKEITHKAIYFKLFIIDGKLKGKKFLVWTTTPWTMPANVALIVNPDFEYGIYKGNGEELILLKSLAEKILGKGYVLEKKIKGKDLKGTKYEAPFDDLPRVGKAKQENPKTFHTVVLDKDLVTEVEGTGIVHCAPGAGEEDFKIGQKENLAVIDVIDESAVYLDLMQEFSGKNAKENPEIIFDYLKKYKNGEFLFKTENYAHRYPTCWRCKTELVWRVVDEWYISMKKLRKPLVEITKKINWVPFFGKERELDWLKNMHDWLISKKRYWGLALPIFECPKCQNFEVIGSKEELKKRSVEGWNKFEGNSPHKPWIDNVKIKCKKCGELISRIPDVGNPWLDAGIVPYSTMRYFSDKKYWKKWFPAELVCESFPGQFKNWFYSLLVMSAVLENTAPAKTIFGFASVRDEKGEEMHKSKGNAIWFDEAVEKIGADPMRWMYSRQNPAENLNFGYNTAEEIKRKLLTLYNSYVFFNTYVKKEELSEKLLEAKSENILDKWILSKIDHLTSASEFNLDKYDAARAVLAIEDFFINDLSLWYIRRSRKRFREDSLEKLQAVATFYHILLHTTKLIAPIMPFFAEEMYQNLKINNMPESVHLCDWPKLEEDNRTDIELENKMEEARSVVSLALAERTKHQIKVKQPLLQLTIKNEKLKIKASSELLGLIKDEVNVREIIFNSGIENEVELDLNITGELKEEGIVREIVRNIQGMRKQAGLTPEDRISVSITGDDYLVEIIKKNEKILLKEFRAAEIIFSNTNFKEEKEVLIDSKNALFKIKKK
ncbi:MAG: isoleucine--tRNA ligase [Candidatus Staskawiczbacteria bacterium RIFOXYC1_FULL_37_43]|nr:MAG: isoleucine--tRNA ligase [Candidatus Staskawiczbacteria bacterium RIFOXYA1_FULL_37_15]OGZ77381.1 MAG: isoleucine--tRNA ligase [Candidatus Staskawiczbacteria bacterium RIFOXYA12_FULL_37_10]OGZ80392.1 MAG: isoleucine--tRNA ligase [Candidatus Staskawiczbacteria bacterium RIFOXYB1_FULL_38_37]OGZ81996.1 MAG: isoleucine--tRNA ligase [Candidatus Staskawiczbacteria bacterium RIFOXYC1_FULL_37_43]OGZ83141.1 MAG: isoleucine--tRNA ligase [Candidatus Staskawiczbacteria bacterium RIFOXYB2_FULL_37_10]